MVDWVRLWHDMPTDPKWRTIARKSGQRVGDVIAVFNFIMVNASGNALERGTLTGFDIEDVATALDLDEDDIQAIMSAMQGKVLDGDKLAGWEKRQPKREDSSASARKAAWKERQKNAPERTGTHRNAPETETETDITPISPSSRDQIFEAAGLDESKQINPGWHVKQTQQIEAWLKDGFDPESQIIPTIRDVTAVQRAKDPGWTAGSLSYFDKAIRRAKPAEKNVPTPIKDGWSVAKWRNYIANWQKSGKPWSVETMGPAIGEAGCLCPESVQAGRAA